MTIEDDMKKYRVNYHDDGEDSPYTYEFEACVGCHCPTEMACMMSITTDRCPKMKGWRDEQKRRDDQVKR